VKTAGLSIRAFSIHKKSLPANKFGLLSLVVKSLTTKDLNRVLLKRNPEYAKGFLDACNLINEMYSGVAHHKYLIGDCALSKVNLIRGGKRIRKNPSYSKQLDEFLNT